MNRTLPVVTGALLAAALLTGCSGPAVGATAAAATYPFVAPSGSMEQGIHAGQTVTAQPVTDYVGRAGDIVAFRAPPGWQPEIRGAQPEFLKRVIAVGGQTVECCDPRGQVLVDGQPLDEPYLYYLPAAGPARQESFVKVTVPPGMLWLMGDSRNNSADSRVPGYGPVPEEAVTAIVSAGG